MPRSSGPARRTQGILGGRSEQVVRRVLDAAIVELAHSGYAGFRMDAVASRAAVNKSTVYRRWPNRAALVAALVERMRAHLQDGPLPDTGQLEGDLIQAFTQRILVGRTVEGRAWARLIAERHTKEVGAIITGAVAWRRSAWTTMISRAVERGELPPATEPQLVLDLVRMIVDGRPSRRVDTSWLTLAVRTVLAGARAGALRPRAGGRATGAPGRAAAPAPTARRPRATARRR